MEGVGGHASTANVLLGDCFLLTCMFIGKLDWFTIDNNMERNQVISQIPHLNCVYMDDSFMLASSRQQIMSYTSWQRNSHWVNQNCTNPNAPVPRVAFGEYTACGCMYYLRLSSAHEQVGSAKKWWGQNLTYLIVCYGHVLSKCNSFQSVSYHPKLPLSHPFWNLPGRDITKPIPIESLISGEGSSTVCYEAI